nr:tyrosine protein kinase Fyn [Hymenolepis microstoma]
MPGLKKGVKAIFGKRRSKKRQIIVDAFEKISTFPAVAVYDFAASTDDELSFKRGDILLLLFPLLENCWMDALDFRTQKSGHVPTSLLTDESGESQALDAFQVTDRNGAEYQLLLPIVKLGTFILRVDHTYSSLSLSVLRAEDTHRKVDHYRVSYDVQGGTYFIFDNETFPSLDEMINAYQNPKNESSSVLLTRPCPKLNKNVEQFNNCMISRESINLNTKIGEGNFGEVWKAEYRGVIVAVKIALVGTAEKDMVKEAATMYKLCHPRLVRFLGVCCEPSTEPLMLITEYMDNGSLENYLKYVKPHRIEQLRILFMVSDGMKYIEEIGAVHNDLRSANVLVDSDGSVKVADFGLSKILHHDSRDKCSGIFPIRWTAIESTNIDARYSIKADVWSFGVLMWEVFTYARYPYEDIENDEEVTVEVAKGKRLPNPKVLGYECDDEFYVKMTDCWTVNPPSRPSFKELYSYFESKIPQDS